MKKILLSFAMCICSVYLHSNDEAIKKQINFKYVEKTLKNGLTVVIIKNPNLNFNPQNPDSITAHVSLVFKIAGANQQFLGLPHLVEHLWFRGRTKIFGFDQYRNEAYKIGIGLKGQKSYTNFSSTVYHVTVLKKNLPRLLEIEAAKMEFLDLSGKPLNKNYPIDIQFKDTDINNAKRIVGIEKKIVNFERDFRNTINPNNKFYHTIFAKMLNEEMRKNYESIGSENDVNNFSLLELQKFHHDYYGPNNAALIINISGSVDYLEILELVEKYFGKIKSRPVPKVKVLKDTIYKKSANEIIINHNPKHKTTQSFAIGFKIPNFNKTKYEENDKLIKKENFKRTLLADMITYLVELSFNDINKNGTKHIISRYSITPSNTLLFFMHTNCFDNLSLLVNKTLYYVKTLQATKIKKESLNRFKKICKNGILTGRIYKINDKKGNGMRKFSAAVIDAFVEGYNFSDVSNIYEIIDSITTSDLNNMLGRIMSSSYKYNIISSKLSNEKLNPIVNTLKEKLNYNFSLRILLPKAKSLNDFLILNIIKNCLKKRFFKNFRTKLGLLYSFNVDFDSSHRFIDFYTLIDYRMFNKFDSVLKSVLQTLSTDGINSDELKLIVNFQQFDFESNYNLKNYTYLKQFNVTSKKDILKTLSEIKLIDVNNMLKQILKPKNIKTHKTTSK